MRICFSGLTTFAIALIAALLSGCSATVDGSLGFDMIPQNQHLTMRHLTIRGNKIVEYDSQRGEEVERMSDTPLTVTSQFRSDSIVASNIGYGLFGVERSDTLGTRRAAFASSIIYMNQVDAKEGFGYMPIFDSMQMLITINDFVGDTITPVRYKVYELKQSLLGNVLRAEDSLCYTNCDITPLYEADKPIFTFTFPKDRSQGPKRTSMVSLDPVMDATNSTRLSAQTWDFVRRLMLIPEDYNAAGSTWDGYGRHGIEVYQNESLWVKNFFGLYIEADETSLPATARGAIYSTMLNSSGLYLRGRNRNPDDPSLIKDTVGMYYYFKDSHTPHNLSANTIRHDFEQGRTQRALMADVKMHEQLPYEERTKLSTCYVTAMAGPVMELYFTDRFIDELLALGKDHTEIGINQALVSLYLPGADYDWELTQSNAAQLQLLLDKAMGRMGMYVKYSSFTPVPDYDFLYEASNDADSSFDGYIYRSRASYNMNITSYMQRLYNYASMLERSATGSYDFESKRDDVKYTPRSIFVGPEASKAYGFGVSVLQGADDGGSSGNRAPVEIGITYTLIK